MWSVFGDSTLREPEQPVGADVVGPSFDEFFSGERAPGPGSPPPPEDADEGAEDLESFTSWLKGLKR